MRTASTPPITRADSAPTSRFAGLSLMTLMAFSRVAGSSHRQRSSCPVPGGARPNVPGREGYRSDFAERRVEAQLRRVCDGGDPQDIPRGTTSAGLES